MLSGVASRDLHKREESGVFRLRFPRRACRRRWNRYRSTFPRRPPAVQVPGRRKVSRRDPPRAPKPPRVRSWVAIAGYANGRCGSGTSDSIWAKTSWITACWASSRASKAIVVSATGAGSAASSSLIFRYSSFSSSVRGRRTRTIGLLHRDPHFPRASRIRSR